MTSVSEQYCEKAAMAASTAAPPEQRTGVYSDGGDVERQVSATAPHSIGSILTSDTPRDTVSERSPADSASEKDAAKARDAKVSPEGYIWVEFDENDPECPFNFSKRRKWTTTVLAVIFTLEVSVTASAFTPGIPSMARDLNSPSDTVNLLSFSIYALGFGLLPLVLAPFSEVYGRNPVYLISNFIYVVLFIGTGFANNMTAMTILRFIQGGMGSTGSTMVGGTIADIFHADERGVPMGFFALAGVAGTGLGPFWAGWVELRQDLQWRWIQWIQAVYTGAVLILMLIFLRETRGGVLLSRRAAKLRKETGDNRYRARAEEERASIPILVKTSLTRPVWMLISEPIVTYFSLWVAFVWGFMYMLLESLSLVSSFHDYNVGQTGLVFLSISLGALIGYATNFIQDRLYAKYFPKKGPEARLFASCVAAVLFPAGCFIYGWTSYPDVSIAGPIVGVTMLMLAVYIIYVAVFNYLADTYLIYASSALAGQSFARNLFGFAFPLFVDQMYGDLGAQWASSLAGFLGAALGIVPFVLLAYGPKIRERSRFSKELFKLYGQKA